VLKRVHGYLVLRKDPVGAPSREIEAEGATVLRQVFAPDEVAKLRAEIADVYDRLPPDGRGTRDDHEPWRYEMLNRSPLAQQAIAHPRILETIEPLLGEDCHVIANTAWRNPADPLEGGRGRMGDAWHVDAGPHVPRPKDVPWDERIPYPVFAIGAHLLLEDCPVECGPTGVLRRSHRSGRLPPPDRLFDANLTYDDEPTRLLTGKAGDVALFTSDVWHRRTPTGPGDRGRFFLQAHYARRDLAQRLRTTEQQNQLSEAAIVRARTDRERRLIGLHPPGFYDG